METIAQAALALLAAAGLLALAWLCFGRLLLPGPWTGAVYAVLPGKGGGGMLENECSPEEVAELVRMVQEANS